MSVSYKFYHVLYLCEKGTSEKFSLVKLIKASTNGSCA